MAEPVTPPPRRDAPASVSDVVDYVTTYAKQETIGPLKGAGRWLGFGVAGAIAIGLGAFLLLLGLLRLIQTEWEWAATGSWSWISYLVVLVVCVLLLVLTVRRINSSSLNKDPR